MAEGPAGLDEILDLLREAAERDAELRRFVDRRISELGTEISCSVQMIEMSERAVHEALTDIHHKTSAIAELRGGLSPANSGVELEAIVPQTEAAAERIMASGERMQTLLLQAADMLGGAEGDHLRAAADREFSEICEACSFQDLTGQRIRGAVAQMAEIAETLDDILRRVGIDDAEKDEAHVREAVRPGMDQGGIDALFP